MPHKDPAIRKAYLREYHRRWYAENQDARREQIKRYKKFNPSKVAEYESRPHVMAQKAAAKRRWRIANRERDNRARRVWSKQNRDKIRRYNMLRDRRAENRIRYLANRDYFLAKSRLRYIAKRDGLNAEQYALMVAFLEGRP